MTLAPLLATVLLAGCTPDPPVVELDDRVPTLARVRATTTGRSIARLWWSDDHLGVEGHTAWEAAPAREHVLPLGPVVPGHDYTLVVELEDGSTLEPLSLEVPAPPQVLSGLVAAPFEGVGEGLVLTVLMTVDQDAVAIVDREGQVRWYVVPTGDKRILTVSLSRDRSAVVFVFHPTDYVTTLGEAHRVALDGSSYEVVEIERMHSGLLDLPEGGMAYLRKGDVPWEGGTLLYDEIWERDASGQERRVFSFLEDFEELPDPLCSCWELLILNDEQPEDDYWDWTHANSLVLTEDGEHYLLMARNLDALLKIHRETGEVRWVLGGPYSDFTWLDPSDQFDHPHMSSAGADWFAVFDNGYHTEERPSRAMIYAIDEEARTAWSTWRYEGFDVKVLGDVVPVGDEVLVSWTTAGIIELVDRSTSHSRWTLHSRLGAYLGRAVPMEVEELDLPDL